MRKIIALFSSLCVLLLILEIPTKANNNEITAIYFYTSSCSTCQKLSSFFDGLQNEHKNIVIKKYNITDLKYKSLMDKYENAYKTIENDRGIVPVVYIKNTHLTGERAITQDIGKLIVSNDGLKTLEISDVSKDFGRDIKQFLNYKILGVFFAGIINGINPCSMSMLLFFISLIMIRKVNLIKIGIAFSIGKFVAYLLLGTVFFELLSKINLGWFHNSLKILTIIVIIVLLIFNLQDFVAAKKEKYNKIKLQLPSKLRKMNHSIIKKVANITDLRYLFLISFVLGMVISLGEFLCTGQIYLTIIVTILQISERLYIKALLYLIIYTFAFIIPLILLTIAINKGKEVFGISEAIREKLHLIKLINAGVFFILFIIVILFF